MGHSLLPSGTCATLISETLSLRDLRYLDASSIGGVPIADLEKKGVPVKDLEAQYYAQRKRIVGFPSEDGVPLPDNAPAIVAKVLPFGRFASNPCIAC